jgi:hypothetical protein
MIKKKDDPYKNVFLTHHEKESPLDIYQMNKLQLVIQPTMLTFQLNI